MGGQHALLSRVPATMQEAIEELDPAKQAEREQRRQAEAEKLSGRWGATAAAHLGADTEQ